MNRVRLRSMYETAHRGRGGRGRNTRRDRWQVFVVHSKNILRQDFIVHYSNLYGLLAYESICTHVFAGIKVTSFAVHCKNIIRHDTIWCTIKSFTLTCSQYSVKFQIIWLYYWKMWVNKFCSEELVGGLKIRIDWVMSSPVIWASSPHARNFMGPLLSNCQFLLTIDNTIFFDYRSPSMNSFSKNFYLQSTTSSVFSIFNQCCS